MATALPISDDRRSRDRLEVDRQAVLRLGERTEPILLEDLTAAGCRFQCDASLPLFSSVSIGIAGVGHTPARLAWQSGSRYGCAFDRPLPASAVTTAAPDNVARIAQSAPAWQVAAELDYCEPEIALLPLPVRLAIISGLTVALWSAIIGVARAVL